MSSLKYGSDGGFWEPPGPSGHSTNELAVHEWSKYSVRESNSTTRVENTHLHSTKNNAILKVMCFFSKRMQVTLA